MPISALAAPVVAELVWFETNEQKQQIRYASYSDDQWTVQEAPLFETKNLISGPTIVTKHSGDKLLVWSESDKNSNVSLMLMKGSKDKQKILWGKPTILHDQYKENLGSSAVVDLNDTVWLVWSASGQKPSDIKLIKITNNSFSAVEDVHEVNNSPDVLPQTNLNNQGQVLVEWQHFDKKQFTHVSVTKKYTSKKLNEAEFENIQRSLKTEITLKEIISPDFIPQNQRLVIHFPQNKLHQSEALAH